MVLLSKTWIQDDKTSGPRKGKREKKWSLILQSPSSEELRVSRQSIKGEKKVQSGFCQATILKPEIPECMAERIADFLISSTSSPRHSHFRNAPYYASWLLQSSPLLLKMNSNPKLIQLSEVFKHYATVDSSATNWNIKLKKKRMKGKRKEKTKSVNQFSNLCVRNLFSTF